MEANPLWAGERLVPCPIHPLREPGPQGRLLRTLTAQGPGGVHSDGFEKIGLILFKK